MHRSAERALGRWFDGPQRKPLVIRGARQVGKSTLVRQFAKSRGLHLNEINLERHPDLESVFRTLDLTRIRRELEGLLGQPLLAPGRMLFLDEIQATPHALPALRYFLEDHPDLPVVAAGSLLEFVLSQHAFPMPVGRIQYFHLGPMSFEEFLAELDPALLASLQDCTPENPLPHTAHTRLSACQREYLLVGGMPEAVAAYASTRSFADVTPVHQSIVDTYQDDFSRYASPRVLLRLQRVFNHVPRSVGHKVKYTQISREETARELRASIDLLAKARVITPVFHSACSGVPLHAEVDWKTYKLLFLDIGLMNRMCGLDWLALKDLTTAGWSMKDPWPNSSSGNTCSTWKRVGKRPVCTTGCGKGGAPTPKSITRWPGGRGSCRSKSRPAPAAPCDPCTSSPWPRGRASRCASTSIRPPFSPSGTKWAEPGRAWK